MFKHYGLCSPHSTCKVLAPHFKTTFQTVVLTTALRGELAAVASISRSRLLVSYFQQVFNHNGCVTRLRAAGPTTRESTYTVTHRPLHTAFQQENARARFEPMDLDLPAEQDKDIRYSDSPRRWTQVTQSLPSPIKSVRPEYSVANMESLDSQIDFGHRTVDIFEDESSDEEPLTARKSITGLPGSNLDMRERSSSPGKRKSQGPPLIQPFVSQCEPKGIPETQPERDQWPLQQESASEGYQRLDSKMPMPIRSASLASTSYNGSIEEVNELPVDLRITLSKLTRIEKYCMSQSWSSSIFEPLSLTQHLEAMSRFESLLGLQVLHSQPGCNRYISRSYLISSRESLAIYIAQFRHRPKFVWQPWQVVY